MSEAVIHDDHHDHKPTGIGRWLFSTNHKDIGTMYLVFSLIMFFVGGAMAMVIRLELFSPGLQFVDPQFFNSMTTVHALVMIFYAGRSAGGWLDHVSAASVAAWRWLSIPDLCCSLSWYFFHHGRD